MDYMEFIKPELMILVPVLYFLGAIIKNTTLCKDKYIPAILGVLGVVLAVLYVLATETITGYQSALLATFTALTQGILVSGAAVYTNQLVKQAGRSE